jgi:hypothetical protein
VKPRVLWTALALVCLALPATAQLTPGTTYAFRGASGKYLSAQHDPAQKLGMSSNTAGWEQWRFISYGGGWSSLVSYHGTSLVLETSDSTAYHAPYFYLDNITVEGVEEHKTPGGAAIGISGPIVVGGKVTLRRRGANATYALADTGGTSPVLGYLGTQKVGSETAVPQIVSFPRDWWTLVAIPAPDMNRLAPQEAAGNNLGYHLRAYNGWYLVRGTYSGLSVDSWDTVLSPTKQAGGGPSLLSDRGNEARPAIFGDPLYIKMLQGPDGRYYWLGPGMTNIGFIVLPSVRALSGQVAANLWTVDDSSGRYKTGDRIPLGVKVTLRSRPSGKQLSADTSSPVPYLTPSSGGAEQWTIVK